MRRHWLNLKNVLKGHQKLYKKNAMRKAGIILIFLLPVVCIPFLYSPSIEKHASKHVIITKKIPMPEPGKTPAGGMAKKNPALIEPHKNDAGKQIYAIQVAAYKSLPTAVKQSMHFKNLGYNTFYNCETIKGKENLFKVYIALHELKKEVEKQALTMKKSGLIEEYIIRAMSEISPAKSSDCELATDIYFLHVSSYKHKKNAEEHVQKLKEHGSQVVAILEDVQGKSWFRVYMGEFKNENKARKFGAKLKEKGLISYFKPVTIDMIMHPTRQPAARPAQKSTALSPPEEPPSPLKEDKPKSMQQPKHDKEKPEELEAKAKLPLIIDDITFRAKNGNKELVLFHANQYFMPSVHFSLEGENPTIAIDIEPPATIKKAGSKIPLDGKWIKHIQIQADTDNKTSKIIVHLYAYKNYKVSQSFYRSEKIFAIKVISE
jgi:hypothetical protein